MFKFKRKKETSIDTEIPKIIIGRGVSGTDNYYRLKDNIIYYSDNGKNKVFNIESSVAGEGKSTVLINLAAALARSGKKVLAIDLDLRRPKLHRAFGLLNVDGIAEYMIDECSKEQMIKKTEYNVDVINRGKKAQNSTLIFTSEKFKNLIEELKGDYDIILLDCPPVLLVSDYIHISKFSDATIFVVSAGITRRSQLTDAIELLRRNNANVLGTVLTYNYSKKMGAKYSGYYYGGKYYRYIKNNYSEENMQ